MNLDVNLEPRAGAEGGGIVRGLAAAAAAAAEEVERRDGEADPRRRPGATHEHQRDQGRRQGEAKQHAIR